jgi:hypothetical protein
MDADEGGGAVLGNDLGEAPPNDHATVPVWRAVMFQRAP